jgi:hypothetical protein
MYTKIDTSIIMQDGTCVNLKYQNQMSSSCGVITAYRDRVQLKIKPTALKHIIEARLATYSEPPPRIAGKTHFTHMIHNNSVDDEHIIIVCHGGGFGPSGMCRLDLHDIVETDGNTVWNHTIARTCMLQQFLDSHGFKIHNLSAVSDIFVSIFNTVSCCAIADGYMYACINSWATGKCNAVHIIPINDLLYHLLVFESIPIYNRRYRLIRFIKCYQSIYVGGTLSYPLIHRVNNNNNNNRLLLFRKHADIIYPSVFNEICDIIIPDISHIIMSYIHRAIDCVDTIDKIYEKKYCNATPPPRISLHRMPSGYDVALHHGQQSIAEYLTLIPLGRVYTPALVR